MTTEISNVYVYKNHMDAENAVRSLGLSGFEMKHLSIVGRGYHTEEHPLGFYSKGDRIRSWGKFGVFWGASNQSRGASNQLKKKNKGKAR
jgi:hypothetical protein